MVGEAVWTHPVVAHCERAIPATESTPAKRQKYEAGQLAALLPADDVYWNVLRLPGRLLTGPLMTCARAAVKLPNNIARHISQLKRAASGERRAAFYVNEEKTTFANKRG